MLWTAQAGAGTASRTATVDQASARLANGVQPCHHCHTVSCKFPASSCKTSKHVQLLPHLLPPGGVGLVRLPDRRCVPSAAAAAPPAGSTTAPSGVRSAPAADNTECSRTAAVSISKGEPGEPHLSTAHTHGICRRTKSAAKDTQVHSKPHPFANYAVHTCRNIAAAGLAVAQFSS